jgi:hypothetical protein
MRLARQTICLVQKFEVLRELVTLFEACRLALAIDGLLRVLREVRQVFDKPPYISARQYE